MAMEINCMETIASVHKFFNALKQGWPNCGSLMIKEPQSMAQRAACSSSDLCWRIFKRFEKLKNYMENLRTISDDDLFL